MPEHLPLVSVIIPFYNIEQFLTEAILSVIDQDYKNWELLLIDDGSFDESTNIAKSYCNQQISYYRHLDGQNKGVAASRNLGISFAKGEFVAFLDGDDKWLKEKLTQQINIFFSEPKAAMICEASLYWHDWETEEKKNVLKEVGVPGDQLYKPFELAEKLAPLRKGKTAPSPSSIIIKKEVLEKVEGFVECFIGIYAPYEDQAFLFKIYLNEFVYVSSRCNNLYRQRTGSVMNVYKIRDQKNAIKYYYLKWAKNYMKIHQIKHPIIENLIKTEIKLYKYSFLMKYAKTFKNKIKSFIYRKT